MPTVAALRSSHADDNRLVIEADKSTCSVHADHTHRRGMLMHYVVHEACWQVARAGSRVRPTRLARLERLSTRLWQYCARMMRERARMRQSAY